MAFHLRVLLIFTGLTGIYSINKVSKLSVKAGDSITIPCLYDSKYRNYVKYLCKGYYQKYCTDKVNTNRSDISGKFSISDDKNQGILTVTIKDLTHEDKDYWCNVEMNGLDTGEYFNLAVTSSPRLYVDRQEIKGFSGDDITISCYHDSSGKMQWCRLGRNCITGPRGNIDGTEVTINSTTAHVFNVTMRKVTTESSGWYMCAQEDLQMPVHVMVTERLTTTTSATTRCTTSEALTSTTSCGETAENSSSSFPKKLIIPLSLLIFIVMVALVIWLILKKHNSSRSQLSTMAEDEGVTYSHVGFVSKKLDKRPHDRDMDVLYSSVVIKKPNSKRDENTR